jgi:ArsR family transcriptional regulator
MKTDFDFPTFFRALADRTRLRLLNLIAGREVCVCYFVDILRTGQPKISRHLAYLRDAGVVKARRDGRWMHYSLAVPENAAAQQILAQVLESLKTDPAMNSERTRLDGVCCAAVPPRRFRDAPRPAAASDLSIHGT